jgi:dCMP deaminase
MINRRNKENYYLDIAENVLIRGTCLRRNFGAIIVNSDQIVSSGYTGAPRQRKNCTECEICVREKFNIPRGERYELCRSVHAEVNAIIFASRKEMLDGTLYLVGKEMKNAEYVQNTFPCAMCKRIIINAGLKFVIIRNNKNDFRKIEVAEWIKNDETLDFVLGY